MIEVQTRIDIAAPAADVWRVLTDFPAFPAWNPFIRQIGGELRVGNVLWMKTRLFGGRIISLHARVTRLDPQRELRWLGHFHIPYLFDGEHTFQLEPLAAQRTRLVHFEHFSGLLIPFFARTLSENTRRGFEDMNQALKVRVEIVAHSQNERRG